MRIHGPAELVVRERLVEVTLARVVDDESAANADHECGAAVRLLDAGAEPRLIEQSGCATDSNSGGDRVTGVGAEGTHTPDRFAGGAGLLTHLGVAFDAARCHQHTAVRLDSLGFAAGFDLGADNPTVFHDQGGEDGFGTKFCVTGALDCGQQSADQCAPTDHRAGSMILTGAVLVEFRTHLAGEVTDVGGIEIERVDGASRVHPAFGLVVVGERTELEFDVRVLLE